MLIWEPVYGRLPEQASLAPIRMGRVLAGWVGTQYMSGQGTKGVAADCLGFVCGVIDELAGVDRAQCPDVPPDAAFHSPKTAYRALARVRRRYNPCRRLRAEGGQMRVRPGDIVIAGSGSSGPAHAMIVGPRRNTIWHCYPGTGVVQTGISLSHGYERLFAAYRVEGIHLCD